LPRLQVLNGKRQGALFDVPHGDDIVIGHRPTADITIEDPWVSWDHSRLTWGQDGMCWIEDLGSTNGTYVNCVRIKREHLRHEDIVFLGKTHVIFLSPAEEMAQDMSPVFGDAASPVFASGAMPPLRVPSSMGAFNSESEVAPPLRDPFASTNATPAWQQQQHAQQQPPMPIGGTKRRDPFADSAVDPFASGPDYGDNKPPPPIMTPAARQAGAGRSATPPEGYPQPQSTIFPTLHPSMPAPPPPPPPSANDPARARRAFADTNADEGGFGGPPPPAGSGRALRLSDLHESADIPDAPRPSGRDIARLVEGGASFDDLDTILGDGRALTPDPSRVQSRKTPGPSLDAMRPSEMRTRPIDTDAMNRLLLEEEQRRASGGMSIPPPATGRLASSSNQARGLPPQPQPQPQQPGTSSNQARGLPQSVGPQLGPGGSSRQTRQLPPQATPPQGVGLGGPSSGGYKRPGGPQDGTASDRIAIDDGTELRAGATALQNDLQSLAFERSRLEYENRTLKAALEAARAQNPQAVKIAADALRDQEMSRLARRLAELEREQVTLRQELAEKQGELDRVTDEMIEKEDRIATLEDQAARGSGDGRAGAMKRGAGESDDDLQF